MPFRGGMRDNERSLWITGLFKYYGPGELDPGPDAKKLLHKLFTSGRMK